MSLVLVVKEVFSVERFINCYWGLEYLCCNFGEVWQVLVIWWLKEEINLGLVLLEELGLELVMWFGRLVEVGDCLEVKVVYVDFCRDEIVF